MTGRLQTHVSVSDAPPAEPPPEPPRPSSSSWWDDADRLRQQAAAHSSTTPLSTDDIDEVAADDDRRTPPAPISSTSSSVESDAGDARPTMRPSSASNQRPRLSLPATAPDQRSPSSVLSISSVSSASSPRVDAAGAGVVVVGQPVRKRRSPTGKWVARQRDAIQEALRQQQQRVVAARPLSIRPPPLVQRLQLFDPMGARKVAARTGQPPPVAARPLPSSSSSSDDDRRPPATRRSQFSPPVASSSSQPVVQRGQWHVAAARETAESDPVRHDYLASIVARLEGGPASQTSSMRPDHDNATLDASSDSSWDDAADVVVVAQRPSSSSSAAATPTIASRPSPTVSRLSPTRIVQVGNQLGMLRVPSPAVDNASRGKALRTQHSNSQPTVALSSGFYRIQRVRRKKIAGHDSNMPDVDLSSLSDDSNDDDDDASVDRRVVHDFTVKIGDGARKRHHASAPVVPVASAPKQMGLRPFATDLGPEAPTSAANR